jgi:hypothetical protein
MGGWNMKQHKWHKEIKAWADGAEIEGRTRNSDGTLTEWHKLYDPTFSEFSVEYRIKPQPKEPKYLYVYKDSISTIYFRNFNQYSELENYIGKIKLEDDE